MINKIRSNRLLTFLSIFIIANIISLAIYYPFIRVMDDQYLREEWKAQEEESEEIDFDSFDFDDL